MQARYLLALAPIAETLAAPTADGFRFARSTADAIAPCQRVWSQRGSAQGSLAGASRSGCESVSHAWLVAHLPMEQALLRQWRPAGFLDQHVLSRTEAGVPQGGVASPVLMPRAWNSMERHLQAALPTSQGGIRPTGHGSKCAADVLATGPSQTCLEEEVHPLVEQCWAARGRELADAKTRSTPSEEGLAVLGTQGRTDRGTL
jgi:RNA-directed DNA polymerase